MQKHHSGPKPVSWVFFSPPILIFVPIVKGMQPPIKQRKAFFFPKIKPLALVQFFEYKHLGAWKVNTVINCLMFR